MAECEKLGTCPFFSGQMKKMPSVADFMRRSYCLGDKTGCARYQLASKGIPVPTDLYPNDTARARKILGTQ